MAVRMSSQTGPQFTPAGGVGSVWTDPQTNERWKYTSKGWERASSGSIQKDVEEKGTFQVKDEEEKVLVDQLRSGGSSQEQIQQGLAERRRVLSNIGQQETVSNEQVTNDPSNPFEGMTKQEMLRDAFNKGVTDVGELEKLESLYDKLVGEDESDFSDLSTLSSEQQMLVKAELKGQVAAKAQGLASATERDAVFGALAIFDTGQELIDILKGGEVKTGLIPGIVRRGVFGIGARRLERTTKEEDYFNSRAEAFAADFRKIMSGTAVSEPEMKRLEQFLPSETKGEQDNIQGIIALSEYLSNKYSPTIGTDLNPLKPTLNEEDEDPLNIFKNTSSNSNPLGI